MLTNEQIKSLFTFCEKHCVQYYDVQVELVDHLANAVEVEIKKDSKLSFEKAVEKVHKSFGVMGFAPLVAEKQKMAEKQSRKLFWKLFRHQLSWPKVLLFFLLTALMFTIFSIDISFLKWFFTSILIASCLAEIYRTLKIRRLTGFTGKKFLLAEMPQIAPLIWIPLNLFYLPRIFDTDFLASPHSGISIFFLSVFLSLFVIMVIATWQTFSSIKYTLYKNYPEVFATDG